jgi:hypothetical protein
MPAKAIPQTWQVEFEYCNAKANILILYCSLLYPDRSKDFLMEGGSINCYTRHDLPAMVKEYWMFCLSNVQNLLFIMIMYELLLLVN